MQTAHNWSEWQASDAAGGYDTVRSWQPERWRAARGRALDGLLLGLLAVLDDVTVLEQDPHGDLAPERRTAQQELEVHAEVLELLAPAHHA
jgi:hypothetical protein